MSMVLITGAKGSGKTLTAVGLAHEAYKAGREVYSNIALSFPHKKLTRGMVQEILRQKVLRNVFILIDEIHVIADSRRAMTKRNINWSYFFTQSRKNGVDIIATTQREMQVDVRFRMNTDFYVFCKPIRLSADKFVIIEEWENYDTGRRKCYVNKYPELSFKLYDTEEIVYYDFEGSASLCR